MAFVSSQAIQLSDYTPFGRPDLAGSLFFRPPASQAGLCRPSSGFRREGDRGLFRLPSFSASKNKKQNPANLTTFLPTPRRPHGRQAGRWLPAHSWPLFRGVIPKIPALQQAARGPCSRTGCVNRHLPPVAHECGGLGSRQSNHHQASDITPRPPCAAGRRSHGAVVLPAVPSSGGHGMGSATRPPPIPVDRAQSCCAPLRAVPPARVVLPRP